MKADFQEDSEHDLEVGLRIDENSVTPEPREVPAQSEHEMHEQPVVEAAPVVEVVSAPSGTETGSDGKSLFGVPIDQDIVESAEYDLIEVRPRDHRGWNFEDCEPDPDGPWVLEKDGIGLMKATKSGDTFEKITRQPIYIKDRAIDIDTGLESITVVWMDGSKVCECTASRGAMSSCGGVMGLANRGYAVNAGNARHIVGYLAHILDWQQNNIPIRHIVSSCGTKVIDGKTVFMIGNNAICGNHEAPEVSFDDQNDHDGVVSNLRRKDDGRLSSWVEMALELGAYPIVAFGIAASFLAPLLKDLCLNQNPIIDYGGVSSTGKTTTLKFCASVWGYPLESDGGLVRSWSGTEVFFERYAAIMNELPIFLDESHKANPKEACSTLYQYANGKGRGRGSLTGIQRNTKYRGVLFSAGECQLTDVGTTNGIQARVISFWGSPISPGNRELVAKINRVSETHYGLSGKAVVLHYLRNRDELLPELREMHTTMADCLANRARDDMEGRIANCFGAVYAAGMLANSVLDLGWDMDSIVIEAFQRVSENRMPSSAHESIELVGSWIVSNWAKFDDGSGDALSSSSELYGRVFLDREDGEKRIAILKDVLQGFLNRRDYSYRSVMSQWIDNGWVDIEQDRRLKKVRFNGTLMYMVVLNQAGIAASLGCR